MFLKAIEFVPNIFIVSAWQRMEYVVNIFLHIYEEMHNTGNHGLGQV